MDPKPKRRIRTLLTLVLSLAMVFSTIAVSYAKYQNDSGLLGGTSSGLGNIEGRFLAHPNEAPQIAVTEPNQPAGPSRIVIPDIGVNAQIETKGLTPENAVDVPKSLWTAAWFKYSSKPGSKGPAMIVGHYSAYGRAVFANLHKLKPGQKIIVTDEGAKPFIFVVKQVKSYPQAEVPMEQLLGDKESKPRLEVITCGGGYIKESRDFTNRTVLTAEII